MKILHVIPGISRGSGGPSRSTQGLVSGLNRAGVEAWLLSLTNDEDPWVEGIKNFVSEEPFENIVALMRPDLVHLHCLWNWGIHRCAVICRRWGIKYVVSPRGMLDPWALSVKKWKKRIARWLYQDRDLRGAAAFHATAELEAENIRTQGFRQPIIVAPNGINLVESGKWKVESVSDDERNGRLSCGSCDELSSAQGDATGTRFGGIARLLSSRASELPRLSESGTKPAVTQARQLRPANISSPTHLTDERRSQNESNSLCVSETQQLATLDCPSSSHLNDSSVETTPDVLDVNKERVAVFMGRLHPGKGLLTLAEAWARVKKSASASASEGWKMVVVGPDSYGHKKDIVAKLEELGIKDEWEFVGMVGDEEKWRYYSQASLLIHPSVSENFGITIAEGLAAGLPVICTKGTPWQDIADHKCGWWIDIGVEPLTKALAEAMALSPDELQAMGARGRKLVEEKYTWDAAVKTMIEGYKEIINE